MRMPVNQPTQPSAPAGPLPFDPIRFLASQINLDAATVALFQALMARADSNTLHDLRSKLAVAVKEWNVASPTIGPPQG